MEKDDKKKRRYNPQRRKLSNGKEKLMVKTSGNGKRKKWHYVRKREIKEGTTEKERLPIPCLLPRKVNKTTSETRGDAREHKPWT